MLLTGLAGGLTLARSRRSGSSALRGASIFLWATCAVSAVLLLLAGAVG